MSRKSGHAALNNLVERLNTGLLDNKIEKTITYVGGTTGATGATTLVSVTGVVALSIFGVCGTSLIGAGATLEVGTSASTAALVAQTTGTALLADEIWVDATPTASVELTSVITQSIVTADVIQTIATAAVTTGAITYYILWSPISSDGNVVLA